MGKNLVLKRIKTSSRILKLKSLKKVAMCVHFSCEYKHRKGHTNEANATSTEDEIITTMSEILGVESKIPIWWYDTCAIVHVSYDKSLFKPYKEVRIMYFMFKTYSKSLFKTYKEVVATRCLELKMWI